MARVRNDGGIPEFQALKEDKQRRLLLEYANNGGRLKRAAKDIGMNWMQHVHWLRQDEKYKEAYEIAEDMAVEHLIEILRGTVVEPLPKNMPQPNYLNAMFLIKGKREQYKDGARINIDNRKLTFNAADASFDHEKYRQMFQTRLINQSIESVDPKLVNPE